MKKLLSILVLGVLFLGCEKGVEVSQEEVNKRGPKLYKECAWCHGDKGNKAALGVSKKIDTFTKDELRTALLGYQDGTYGGKSKKRMQVQVEGLSKKDIEILSVYISSTFHKK